MSGGNAEASDASPFSRLVFEAKLAEREGFEPPIRLPVCRISSAVHSTALPPLRDRRFTLQKRASPDGVVPTGSLGRGQAPSDSRVTLFPRVALWARGGERRGRGVSGAGQAGPIPVAAGGAVSSCGGGQLPRVSGAAHGPRAKAGPDENGAVSRGRQRPPRAKPALLSGRRAPREKLAPRPGDPARAAALSAPVRDLARGACPIAVPPPGIPEP